ncbi:hypothetical protein [Streptomyces sp. CB03911]|uniref:hypothetical protein n=1 Tax=Streptomyces sp. CB03911 TaxID=1804758 RepID=UPI000939F3B8|nr:hypothetical protein [Streptomyces sp. CB03911]OKI16564.1 hypothetical protein A6A07_11185 [Streptomyces sp. CB03911]
MSSQPRSSHRISGPALWHILDIQRQARRLSWRGVARETGTATGSLFTRLQRDDISLHGDSLVSLLVWLGLDEQIRPLIVATGSTTAPGPETEPPGIAVLVHILRNSKVSHLQRAFRECDMKITFDATPEEPTS